HKTGLRYATEAAETADKVNAALPRAWSRNFMGIAHVGMGRVAAGFEDLDASFTASVAGDFGFQIGNAVYNATWLAVHLVKGNEVAKWSTRIPDMPQGNYEPWPSYSTALIALAQGRAADAQRNAEVAIQKG